MHMQLYHSHSQLKKWGINRNFIKYQLHLISAADLRKTIKKSDDERTTVQEPSTLSYGEVPPQLLAASQDSEVAPGLFK